MKYLITISYFGKNFCGYQSQPNQTTIQGEIERSMKIFFGEKIYTFGSGRTDSGVHAISQKAHFEYDLEIDKRKFLKGINAIIHNDIAITNIEKTNIEHARKSSKKKTYNYKMYISDYDLPLLEGRAAREFKPVNLEKMQQATKLFLGKHDFENFSAKGSSAKTTVRTIFDFDVKIVDDVYEFFITGDGFLYKMVRNVIGAIKTVGQSKMSIDDLQKIIEKKKEFPKNLTMPACGLYLFDVEYDN